VKNDLISCSWLHLLKVWSLLKTRGDSVLELAKGKFAVEVASPSQLIPTLELIKTAIDAGELDEQLEATAGSVKAAFKRGTGS
jgi:hypothetical protein